MKKRIVSILLILVAVFFCIGCSGVKEEERELPADKICLIAKGKTPHGYPYYVFAKKISGDMIFETKNTVHPDGYQAYGESTKLGQWTSVDVWLGGGTDSKRLEVIFDCWSEEGMGDTKLNIYFNYTVASTGERKEEVWEVDFGQKVHKYKR